MPELTHHPVVVRIAILVTLCPIAVGVAVPGALQAEQQSPFAMTPQVVQTASGLVQGTALGDLAWAWLGIPYARPPFGPLRWKAPQDPDAWSGVRPCGAPARRSSDRGGVEDRLYLNVWRPQTGDAELPVLVDIHGGGNMSYDGMANVMRTVAAQANCVVVTMNYRIGAFGWFTHPALRSNRPGDERNDSGNFGLLDIIKALQWVERNIESFGGDPGNVTLSGESSGASNVAFLLHSKPAAPLFHKAFLSSAYPFAAPLSRGDKAARLSLINMLVNAGVTETRAQAQTHLAEMTHLEVAGFLRGRTPRELKAGYRGSDGRGMMDWGDFDQVNIPDRYRRPGKPELVYGFADGHVVSGQVDFGPGNWFPKPVMIGTNSDENKYFHHDHFRQPFVNAVSKGMPLNEAIEAGLDSGMRVRFDSVSEFRRAWNFINRMTTSLFTYYGAQHPAREMARAGHQPVYVYRFDYGSGKYDLGTDRQEAFRFFLGASHGFELPFFFDWMDVEPPRWVRRQKEQWTEQNYPGRKALAAAMSACLKAFLHSPDGTIRKSPEMPLAWLPWTAEEERFMTFDADAQTTHMTMNSKDIVATPDDLKRELEAWPDRRVVDYIKYFLIYSYQKNWY